VDKVKSVDVVDLGFQKANDKVLCKRIQLKLRAPGAGSDIPILT